MWQPGESKPEAASNHTDMNMDTLELGEAQGKGNKSSTPTHKNTSGGNTGLQKTPLSSSKKLSGTTMNMRFMQRKAEEKKQQEIRRRSAGDSMAVDRAVSPKRPQHTNDDGEDDDDDDDDMSDDEEDDEAAFQVAGAEDMYGPQAHVLGRRSFGGFNKPMEEAMKSSHQSESGVDGNKKPKVSDDELLKRYEVYVKNGRRPADAARPVGNLQKKRKANNSISNNGKRNAKR
jgi:hypothetical protein